MTIRRLATSAVLAAMVTTGACVNDREKGRQPVSTAAVGGGASVGGYLLGDLVGGHAARAAKVAGAGIGGIPSTGIGAYMDTLERDMRALSVGTDVRVVRQGDDLILTIPSGSTFAYKSDAVAAPFQRTLDQVAGVLSRNERTYVDVYGHTDATASDGYNQALSDRRARSVAQYLASRGVKSARIGTRGFGKFQPIASNETAEGQAANRRVEIKIVPIPESDVR